jgi:hypothetical protein
MCDMRGLHGEFGVTHYKISSEQVLVVK